MSSSMSSSSLLPMYDQRGKIPNRKYVNDMEVDETYMVGEPGVEGSFEKPQSGVIKPKKLINKTLQDSEEGIFLLTFTDEKTGTTDKPIQRVYDFVYEIVPEEKKPSTTGGKRKSRRNRTSNKYRKNNRNNRKNKRKTIRRHRRRHN